MLAMVIDRQFTINEVAELLKLNEKTIRRWIKSGRLKATPFPGRGRSKTEYRIPESAIVALGFEAKEQSED
jgi:excisionase family DNA binding protein